MIKQLLNPRSPWRLRIVTLAQLNRALSRVCRELERHGFWDERLADVDVHLVPLGPAYGWQYLGSSGEICIPVVSLARLSDLFRGTYNSLADVVRHEYGHALADTHRGLFRSPKFREAFGASHADNSEFEYDPDCHVSPYASTNACEDFAETFMLYLRHRGRLPAWHRTVAKQRKWRFIRSLERAVQNGQRTW